MNTLKRSKELFNFRHFTNLRYLTLASSEENKDTIKKFTELWVKIKDLIKPITNTSGDYN